MPILIFRLLIKYILDDLSLSQFLKSFLIFRGFQPEFLIAEFLIETRKKRWFFNDSAAWLQKGWARGFSGGEEWGVSPYPTTIGKCGGRIITVNTILVHRFAHFAEGGKLPPPTSTPTPTLSIRRGVG